MKNADMNTNNLIVHCNYYQHRTAIQGCTTRPRGDYRTFL